MDETDRLGLLDDMETFIQSDFGGVVTRRWSSRSRPPSSSDHDAGSVNPAPYRRLQVAIRHTSLATSW